jgi:hypothetical protein
MYGIASFLAMTFLFPSLRGGTTKQSLSYIKASLIIELWLARLVQRSLRYGRDDGTSCRMTFLFPSLRGGTTKQSLSTKSTNNSRIVVSMFGSKDLSATVEMTVRFVGWRSYFRHCEEARRSNLWTTKHLKF